MDFNSGALSRYNVEIRKFVEISRFMFDEICELISAIIYPMEEHIMQDNCEYGHLYLQVTPFPSLIIPAMDEMRQSNAGQQQCE